MTAIRGAHRNTPVGSKSNHSIPVPNQHATDVVVIHFVEDGITAFGKVWYRGEELQIEKGTPEWERTLDANGKSWTEYDEPEQIVKWDQRMFRPGTWVGTPYDTEDPDLTEAERAALEAENAKKAAAAAGLPAPEAAKPKRGRPGPPPKVKSPNSTAS